MLAVMPATGRAQAEQWQVGTAPSFSSGRYGTDTRTEVLHTPISARRLFADGDLTLVFPFTCIRGDGAVTVVSGAPVRTGDSSTSGGATSARGTTTPGRAGTSVESPRTAADATAPDGTTTVSQVATTCGMGDVIVRGRYYVLDERGWFPTVALRAHLKAPTADAEGGLGTGRADEGIGVEVSRTFAGGTTLMVDGGYTVIGRPAGVAFNNRWWYDAGIGQDVAGWTRSSPPKLSN
jgi:hypothetical protein